MDDLFSMFGGGRQKRGPRKGEDVVHRLQVSLKDFYMGCTKYVVPTSYGAQQATLLPVVSLPKH